MNWRQESAGGLIGKILIIVAHPNLKKSRANRLIVDSLRARDGVTIHELYEKYPNFHIDVAHEKRLLLEHDTLVFQQPFYWYSMPALLKQWEDDVLEIGFAYGPGGTQLKGKKFQLSLTAGGPKEAYCAEGYNNFTVDALIAPYRQTANLCGLVWQPPLILHSAIKASDDVVTAHVQSVHQRILELQQ